jgi:23S rRNA (adenine2503-C2)-methyltransferase
LGIGARHISISTCGILPGIKKFSENPLQLNLAISLHAPNDQLRASLMPVAQENPLVELMAVIREYVQKRSRRVMFEYMLIDGVNDSKQCARELADLMDHKLYMVNLIRYNPTGKFKPSRPRAIRQFKEILLEKGINVTQRQAFGGDISAACGQLAGGSRKPS